MANIKRPITSFGWEVKKRLAELQMTQKEFCTEHGISEYRFSNVITGVRPAKKEREKIAKILGINEEFALYVPSRIQKAE